MKITKETLLSLISESIPSNIYEMARHAEANQRPIYLVPKTIADLVSINRKNLRDIDVNALQNDEWVIDDRSVLQNFKNFNIPYKVVGWFLGDEQRIIYTCGEEIQQWLNNNQDTYQKICDYFNVDDLWQSNTSCPQYYHRKKPEVIKSVEDPTKIDMSIDTAYKGAESRYTARTWILRGGERKNDQNQNVKYFGLNSLIKSYFGDDEMVNHLRKVSIPIVVSLRENKNLGIAREGKITNDEILYEFHNFDLYKTNEDFRNAVRLRLRGNVDEVNVLSDHMARQNVVEFRRWREDKKSIRDYQGKSPIYLLDRYGLDPNNNDVTIKSILNIRGTKAQDTFTWTVSFITKMGQKETQQYQIEGGLKPETDLTSTKVAQIQPPGKEFDDYNVILFDGNVYNALKEAMNEVRTKLLEITPIQRLRLTVKTEPTGRELGNPAQQN